MQDKAARLQEQRTYEAIEKKYMGSTGRIAGIAKNLGHAIWESHNSGVANFLTDPYECDENTIPTMDENEYSYQIGWFFSGLRYGLNLEIKLLEDQRTLSVRYNGQIVYAEDSGQLECYCRGEWETKIQELVKLAEKIGKEDKELRKIEQKQQFELNRDQFIEQLKLKWGT